MATNEEILTPKVLIVPQGIGYLTAPKGSLTISGSKLWVCTAVGTWELVTSS